MTDYVLSRLERLEAEATRPIAGWPGYPVTAAGDVIADTGWRGYGPRTMETSERGGYLSVRLTKGSKRKNVAVHRLVAEAFHGPRPSPVHQVRHLNGRRFDNRAANLAWGTAADNARDRDRHGRTARGDRNGVRRHPERVARGERQGSAKLTASQVRTIRERLAQGHRQRDVAADFGVSQRAIHNINARKTWKHVQ